MNQSREPFAANSGVVYGPNPDDRSSPIDNLPEYYDDHFPKAAIDNLIRGTAQYAEIEFQGRRILAIRLPSGQYAVAYAGGVTVTPLPTAASPVMRSDRFSRVLSMVATAFAVGAIVYSIQVRDDVRAVVAALATQQKDAQADASVERDLKCLSSRLDALTSKSPPGHSDAPNGQMTKDSKQELSAIARRTNDLTQSVKMLEQRLVRTATDHQTDCRGKPN